MEQELKRTFETFGEAVMEFIRLRLAGDPKFTLGELRYFVQNAFPSTLFSPSTPDRVLRELRLQNKLNYVVLNRSKSLYEARPLVVPVNPDQKYIVIFRMDSQHEWQSINKNTSGVFNSVAEAEAAIKTEKDTEIGRYYVKPL